MSRKAPRGPGKGGKRPPPQRVEQLVALCRAQRFDEAAPLAREFTRKWPRQAVGWHALAACSQAAGKPAEAIRAYREALKLEPDNPDGHNNLGLLLAERGEPEEAVKSYRRALRLRPRFVHAQYNLGLVLAAAGRLEEAAEAQRRTIELEPRFAEAHNHLGNVLRELGRLEEAADCYRRALDLQPDHAEVHGNLGNVLAEQGDRAGAEAAHRRALELRPDYAEGHANLGNLLRDAGRLAESEAVLQRALELRPDDPGLEANLAATLLEQGRVEQAVARYRAVVERRPEQAEAHENLGNALADLGEVEAAAAAYRRALELRPGDARAWYHLSLVKRFGSDDPDWAGLEQALARDDLGAPERAWLEYAAGKACADRGEPAAVTFAHFRAGAAAKRATLDYDVGADEQWLQSIARAFSGERLAALAGCGHDSAAPVFIVGMPRSGTTLVEQILASHPRVHGAGERPELRALVERRDDELGRRFPDWVDELSPAEAARLGRDYCESVLTPAGAAARVTDKMPANFAYLGLIRAILPGARVIHVRRDPADTCVSCYTYLFSGRQAFSYDLGELGRYYRAYDRLMQHWRTVLPEEVLLELEYEQLVQAPEAEVARLLAHCGLEWDDACLQFHRSGRAVRTASAQQVRQPLYRGAIGRWQAYREQLAPLFEALGPLAPEPVRE